MKQKLVLSVILGILTTGYGFSQSITAAEYFFDGDPGFGEGIPITIDTPFDTVEQTFAINLSDTMSLGYHWLNIRSRDADGKWSIAKGHKIYVFRDAHPNIIEDQPDVTGFEYFIDEDPDIGMGTWIDADAPGDSLTKIMEVAATGLAPGYHYLYARPRDADGRWGLTKFHKFYVFSEEIKSMIKTSPPIVAAEYFFDEEVPFGQGTPIPITKGDSVEKELAIEVTGLAAGEHHLVIRVQDSVGTWSIAYSKPFSVVGLSSINNSPICQGSAEGEATIRITGGKAPYTFLWNDPEQQSDSTATGLRAGNYTVTVQDAEGAVIRETVEITEFDTIQIAITTSDTECKQANGSATATATGDNSPFSYLWSSGSDEESATGLSSGIYEVTVTDNAGCQNKAVATVNDIGGPQIDMVGRVQHLECAGDANGIIDPLVTGGVTYAWSNGETTKTILNLTAGTYELTVTDAQDCIASQSVKVEEPQPITFTVSVVEADCGLENGAATVSVQGGTPDYAYNWPTRPLPHKATMTGLDAGVYSVTVTDGEGCTALAQVAVGEKGAPTVNVTAITQSTCGNTDGSILIAVSGGTGSYTYDWKNEAGASISSSKDLITVGPGIYSASISDGSGCKTFVTATIPAEQPPVELICLITVDTATGKNLIVWNETPGKGIEAYRLYRETTSAGVFDSIAYVLVDSFSYFIDEFADPVIRSWRYRIAAINSCGVESRLSPPHKTMHLTISLGLGGLINLIWNHYEGYVPYESNYKIWRHTPGIGWEMINVVPSNLNSYVDDTAPDADLWYYVEAVHPNGCTPVKASTYNSSRSNRKNKLKSTAVGSFESEYNLIVYPNPSEGEFKLMMDMERPEDLDIKVFDLSGKLVYNNEFRAVSRRLEHDINLSHLEKGLYQLHLKTERGIFNKTLIIQ